MTTFKDKDIQVCFNPHFDAVSLWLGSFGGADSPCDISRGVFAAKRGVPRLLEFFRRYDITTTWHITGHSMESFPKAAEMIAKEGHEIGVHGYSHENPIAMSPQQERDVLDKSIELCRNLTGQNPKGYATPWAEFSNITVDLLLERGFSHEYSMMEEDCFPYYLRTGDSWTKIDYTRDAADWMKPWVPGKEVDIVEIPLSWHLDDAPPTMFVKTAPNSHGWVTGQEIGQIWIDYFDWNLPQPRLRRVPIGAASRRRSQATRHAGAGAARRPHSEASGRQDGDARRDGCGFPQAGAVRVEQHGRRRSRALDHPTATNSCASPRESKAREAEKAEPC